ncbi:MAG: alpha/beta hydrolase [Candidatus Methanoperedens sp.]|nr:alpha/beta hydrolase [Candidatus Methanoperedens sp.]
MIKQILIAITAILLLTAVIILFSYQSDISKAQGRIKSSQIIETSCGSIEYATRGEGSPVLVIHGAGGGYDQGLYLSEVFLSSDFSVISPSRYGFLQTPAPINATAAAQADTYVCLLDALNISKVGVVGISAGGPSSLEFALRHPDRVSALVLVSAVVHKEKPMDFKDKIIHYVILKSDFLFWMFKYFESSSFSFFGVPPEVQANLTQEERNWLNVFIPSMNPISQRQAGMVNDRINSIFQDYQLEKIVLPTMIVYARDDTLVNPTHSEYASSKIPDAKVIKLESGGHLLMGQQEMIRTEIVKFLKQG